MLFLLFPQQLLDLLSPPRKSQKEKGTKKKTMKTVLHDWNGKMGQKKLNDMLHRPTNRLTGIIVASDHIHSLTNLNPLPYPPLPLTR